MHGGHRLLVVTQFTTGLMLRNVHNFVDHSVDSAATTERITESCSQYYVVNRRSQFLALYYITLM